MLSAGRRARRKTPSNTRAAGWPSLPRIPGLGEGIEMRVPQESPRLPLRLAPSALNPFAVIIIPCGPSCSWK